MVDFRAQCLEALAAADACLEEADATYSRQLIEQMEDRADRHLRRALVLAVLAVAQALSER